MTLLNFRNIQFLLLKIQMFEKALHNWICPKLLERNTDFKYWSTSVSLQNRNYWISNRLHYHNYILFSFSSSTPFILFTRFLFYLLASFSFTLFEIEFSKDFFRENTFLYIPDVLAVMIDEPFLLRKIELRQNLQKILGKENASFFTCLRIPLLVLCGFKSFIEFFRDFKFYLAASIE